MLSYPASRAPGHGPHDATHRTRGRLLFAALLVVLALATCNPFTNPVDPGSTSFTGELVLRNPPEKQILPEVERWMSVAQHGTAGTRALQIGDASYGEPGFFIEPRIADQFGIVLAFAEPVYPETFSSILVLLAANVNGTPVVNSIAPTQFMPEQHLVTFRIPEIPGIPDPTTVLIRLIGPSGEVLAERSFGLLRGDADGNGFVDAADQALITSLDGQAVSTSADHVRADLDRSGVVTTTGDGTALSAYTGNDLPGPPPDLDNPGTPTPTFTVTFDSNGGSAVAPQVVTQGGLVTPPTDPILSGWNFGGWFANIALTIPWNFGADAITAPTTIYARWSPYLYTVVFDGDGATTDPVPASIDVISPETTVLTLPTEPTRAGFFFGGWFTEPFGEGEQFNAVTPVTAPITVYAFWSLVQTYTVTFESNGGSAVAPEIVPEFELVTEPAAPLRPGYTFSGWFVDPGLTTLWNFAVDTVTANLTIYASWTANTYDIVFDAEGGIGAMPLQPVVYEVPDALDLNAFTRSGYTFDGWSLTPGGPLVYADGAAYTHTTVGNQTLYARWLANTYNILFDPYLGAGTMTPQPVDFDATVTLTANAFTFVGYIFDGWSLTPGGAVVWGDGASYTHATEGDVTLYARWLADPTYTVTYDGNLHTGGSPPVDGTSYLVGAMVTPQAPGSLVRLQDGISLRFAGWNQIGGGGGTRQPGVDFPMPAANIILEAIWEVIGGTGPGGGLVFHDKGFISDGWRYLEAAPVDQSGGIVWGGLGTPTGATSAAIGVGRLNTLKIVAALGPGPYAASVANDYDNGFTDWFLPSQNELDDMYANLHVVGLGGFGALSHWSSRESDANNALYQDFSTGAIAGTSKGNAMVVRAARAFRSPAPTFGVLYLPNGADSGTPPVDPFSYEPVETVTVAGPSTLGRLGNTFGGWNTDGGGLGTAYPPGAAPMPSANLTLYAQWTPDAEFAGGDGSPGAPYQVATATQLNNVRNYLSASFVQTANIDLGVSPWIDGVGWEPIGTDVTPFTGVYDGAGLTISGLTINRVEDNVGLFGRLAGATIERTRLEGVSVFGFTNTGALVGSSALTPPSFVRESYATGTVDSDSFNVGGLIGFAGEMTIERTFSAVAVESTLNAAELRIGGLVGMSNSVMIDNSYAVGTVTTTGGQGFIGGLLGGGIGTTISRSYAAGRVTTGGAIAGGLAGDAAGVNVFDALHDEYTTGVTGPGVPTASLLKQTTFVAWDFTSTWAIDEDSSYPYLQWYTGPAPVPATAFSAGDAGPAGGIVFYDKSFYSDGWRYMEAAPVDLAPMLWGADLTLVGTIDGIGQGRPNTISILGSTFPGDAAFEADQYTQPGFADYFLPSLAELQEMLLHKVAIGLFNEDYWSSFELDAANVWTLHMGTGIASNPDKSTSLRVRPIRQF